MRLIALVVVAALAAGAACDYPFAPGVGDDLAELASRKGELVGVEDLGLVEETPEERFFDLRLSSSSGLEVTARLRVPSGARAGDGRAGVVLAGGRDTGRDAVRRLPPGLDELVISFDYPELLKEREEKEVIRRTEDYRDAAWEVPAILMLLADYLATRPEVDANRIALVGASFGGFFAPVAAAADPRFGNVALIYTGAGLHLLVEQNLKADVPPAARQLGAELAVLPIQRLEPARYVGRIAPRPLLLVNGLFDDRITRESAEALLDAARPPKEIVWLPTGHLESDSLRLIRELVDTAFARLPLLRGTR
ncbi:MAG: prolyl oligopeptidase family serine peptidase [Gemmatimonadetes bacterium]|nr:prolyl oligopeptidase family serine peptidase [Gemmatimonadota bacterium]